MSCQILTLENNRICLYKRNSTNLYNWDINSLIEDIDIDNKLYIVYLETIMYHKNLLLNDLEKNNIKYEIMSKSFIEVNKYIYNYWITEDEEIIDVNRVHLFIIMNLQKKDLNISIFELNNTINKLEIKKIYEDYIYIGNEKDEQYLFMDIMDEIERIMRRLCLRSKTIAKILLIGEKIDYEWFISLFNNRYSKELIDVFNYDIKEALHVYLNIKNKVILDPFVKYKIKYLPKEIILREISKDIDISRSIQVVNRFERLPINKSIIISPISSIGENNIFSAESDDAIYFKEISFPFTYNFDELKFNFKIENENDLKVSIYINDSIIDTWDIG